jgi:hypothetical protein
MVQFVSFDTYEQKLSIIQTATLIIKEVSQIILTYDCVCVKPGMAVNCVDKFGKIYYATVLWMNTNSAIVYYHGWKIGHNEEVRFDKISFKNREEVIQSHFYYIFRGKSKEECLSRMITLEKEGFPLNIIIFTMYYLDFATVEIEIVRQEVIRTASRVWEEFSHN